MTHTPGHPSNATVQFDEFQYLTNNPDVAQAVGAGDFASGFDHFQQFGDAEGRQGDFTVGQTITGLVSDQILPLSFTTPVGKFTTIALEEVVTPNHVSFSATACGVTITPVICKNFTGLPPLAKPSCSIKVALSSS